MTLRVITCYFLLYFLWMNPIFSQSKIIEGDIIKNEDKSLFSEILGNGEEGIYVLRNKSGTFNNKIEHILTIIHPDSLTLSDSYSLNFPPLPNSENQLGEVFTNEHGSGFFLSGLFRDKAKRCLYQWYPSREDSLLQLTRLHCENGVSAITGGFFTSISNTNNHFIALNTNMEASQEQLQIEIRAFNQEGNKEWQTAFLIPYHQRLIQIRKVHYISDSSIFIISELSPLANELNRLLVFHFNKIENRVTEFDMAIPGKNFYQQAIKKTDDGSLLLGGVHQQKLDRFAPGIFIFGITPDGKNFNARIQLAKKDLQKINQEAKQLTMTKASDISVENLDIDANGNVWTVFSIKYNKVVCETDPKTGLVDCAEQYFFGDLFVFSSNNQDSIRFVTKIPRHYQSNNADDPYTGIESFFSKGNYHLLFNDKTASPDGLDIGIDKSRSSLTKKNPSLVEVMITKEGEAIRTVKTNYPSGHFIQMSNTKKTGNSTILGYGEENKEYRFYKIAY